MKHKRFGVFIVVALVLGMSVCAWAQTACDETSPDFYADFTSGVNVGRIHSHANLLKKIPITIENFEFSLPIPEDFCMPLESGFLDALEPFLFGTHTFDFSLDTEADLINEVAYAVTADLGLLTIDIDMGTPGGAPYLGAEVSFGNVASDCSMYNPLNPLDWIPLAACQITADIFDGLIQNASVYFIIDTIHVTQEIDTCVIQEDGICEAVAEVASTTATQTGFHVDTEFGNIMDDIISALTGGMVAEFIGMAFSLNLPEEPGICEDLTSVTTFVLLIPYLTRQENGCSPPPELLECRGVGCSTAPKNVSRQSSSRAVSVALYILPAAVLFGLIIWRRKK